MARQRINHESTTARFPLGTLERMEAILDRYEGKADFIRDAVLTKIKMREGVRSKRKTKEADAAETETAA